MLLYAARAQSSANKRSRMVESVTLVAALKCLVLVVQRPRSHLDLMLTPSVEVLKATCNIAEKNIENKVKMNMIADKDCNRFCSIT